MNDMIINIATDFYPRPAGRFSADGEYTGESFRENQLKPKLLEVKKTPGRHLIVDFTGVTMAGSSFLEEAFGGLVRNREFTKEFLREVLIIRSPRRPIIKDRIETYINEA
ncbi:STAS-like domain-containing protein [Acinetobacter baumannii]|uniref:STAS-like domain-containing protein n=1 Tax=Acinetobacter calcoaceticus/baumannii complex TaxID=909768 RepID=UPI0018A6FD2D|nr:MULTISPECIES: STAS-like domain-containing protein [Acinetobacter calcoaceticus/baumannii complex]EJB8517514.1 STAS-like domain-containing protein [Acinetobacter baumannii]ELA7467191.1 STAS-like domain-containing protein [Acinetobacter nosocomialis]MBF8316964.1 STAS-like domain-containing protein [Acinetobacter baumannii]MBR7771527.1 STAS-like domain-containing protein [Acinetobacter nosocomialis]MDC4593842.1 STAS-like domain-containing protein [Acinetobacter baumannii]